MTDDLDVSSSHTGAVGSSYTSSPGYVSTNTVPTGVYIPKTSPGSHLYHGITTTQNSYQPNYHTNIQITGTNPTISTEKNKINLDELADLMKIMQERLLILVPNFEKHEKYEALKKAYDHYKLIESIVNGDANEQDKG